MASSSTASWMPPFSGRKHCDVGSSLNRYLRSRQGLPAPNKKAGMPDRDFYALRYNFKPAGVDGSKEGTFICNSDTKDVNVELPGQSKGTTTQVHHFHGSENSNMKEVDCVLIYDPEQGTLVLEKLDACFNLTHTRSKRDPNAVTVRPSPSFQDDMAGTYNILADPDAPSEQDDGKSVHVSSTVPPNAYAETLPSRPSPNKPTISSRTSQKQSAVKYEEEEGEFEDDTPLMDISHTKKAPSHPPSKVVTKETQPPPQQTATPKTKRVPKRPAASLTAAVAAGDGSSIPVRPAKKPKLKSPPPSTAVTLALPTPSTSTSTNPKQKQSKVKPSFATVQPVQLALPGSSELPSINLPTSLPHNTTPALSTSTTIPPEQTLADDDEDDEDDWDEVSPSQPPEPAPHKIVMEEDLGDSFAPPRGVQEESHHEEDIEALFEAEFEQQEQMDAEGEGDDDFLAEAVSPVLEATIPSGILDEGPISLHRFAAAAGGLGDSDEDFSSSDESDD